MLFLRKAQQTLAPQRRAPHSFQIFKRKSQRIPFRKHQYGMTGNQFSVDLPRQFSEQTFGAISANGNPKAFSHNDADSARTSFRLTDQQIEAGRGCPPAMLLDILDVSASAKKGGSIPSAL